MEATTKLTNEQITAKAEALEKKHGCEILPIEIIDPNTGEQLLAFVKDAELELVQKAIDLFSADRVSEARQIVFEVGLLREESHPRFYSGEKRDKKVILGAHIACNRLIGFYMNQYKKK